MTRFYNSEAKSIYIVPSVQYESTFMAGNDGLSSIMQQFAKYLSVFNGSISFMARKLQ